MKSLLTTLIFSLCVIGANAQYTAPNDKYLKKANKLAQKYIITDGHVDLPFRLKVTNFRFTKELIGIPIETDKGDFDFKRAKQGGLDAPFMSIYIPASYQETGGAKVFADSLIDMVNGIATTHPTYFGVAHTPAQAEAHIKAGRIALPMGMENGAPLESDLANVKYFRDRGISYITLTHSKDNFICDSSYDTTGTHGGLSPMGRQVVQEMNKVGIMVDISHVSDNTFWQVMEMTDVPCIASHSSARKFTPDFERNMDDEMIKRLGQENGVIQINFGSTFLDGEVAKMRNKMRADLAAVFEEKGIGFRDDAAKPIIEEYMSKNRDAMFSDVNMVADHIDHVVKLTGSTDHVGFGSDYDGVGDSLPAGLKDVAAYPNLIAELLRRGYSKKDIKKMCYTNVWRVWNEVIEAANGEKA